MYELNATAIAGSAERPARRKLRLAVGANVWYLGLTSLLTDISSEAITSILPLYLVLNLRVAPMAFGTVDAIYQGVAAMVRPAGGFLADRARRYKPIALVGYAISAATRLGLLLTGAAWPPVAALIFSDRFGKGIRTAPRDALIAMSAAPDRLGAAFGIHRALDAAGVMSGPILAFALLAWLPGHFDVVFVTSFWIALIGIAVLVLFVREKSPQSPQARADRVTPRAALALFADPPFRTVAITSCLLGAATLSDAFVYLIAQANARIAPALFPLFFVATPLCYFLFAGPLGAIADRIGPRNAFLAGHVPLIVLYGVLVPSTMAAAPIAAVVLLGIYYAATDGVLAAAASATLPVPLRGTGLALVAAAANLGRLVASVTFGVIWSWGGRTMALLVFVIALSSGLVFAFSWFRVPKSRTVANE